MKEGDFMVNAECSIHRKKWWVILFTGISQDDEIKFFCIETKEDTNPAPLKRN